MTEVERRLEAIENRLQSVEKEIDAIRIDRVILHTEISNNTNLTKDVRDNVQNVIDLLRGSKVVAYVIAWSAAVATGASGLWALWHSWLKLP